MCSLECYFWFPFFLHFYLCNCPWKCQKGFWLYFSKSFSIFLPKSGVYGFLFSIMIFFGVRPSTSVPSRYRPSSHDCVSRKVERIYAVTLSCCLTEFDSELEVLNSEVYKMHLLALASLVHQSYQESSYCS